MVGRVLFGSCCPACRGPRPRRRPLCAGCADALRASRLVDRPAPPPGLDGVDGLYRYEPVVQALVLAAKNADRRPLLDGWGRSLADAVSGPIDVVTWVPASRRGARARGYDQGRLLARALARSAGLPHRRLLVRGSGPARTGRSRSARLDGPPLRTIGSAPARVLLVDDVWTTGGSLSAGARALRAAGACSVVGAVVAVVGDRPSVERRAASAPVDRGRPTSSPVQ